MTLFIIFGFNNKFSNRSKIFDLWNIVFIFQRVRSLLWKRKHLEGKLFVKIVFQRIRLINRSNISKSMSQQRVV